MQAKAIFEAAIQRKEAGGDPHVEIMIPLIVTEPELALPSTGCARSRRSSGCTAKDDGVDYLVGTMVETPRAAIVADEIAEAAEFFSFGTNDLTQMTFGFSRDDVEGRFMPDYLELKLLDANPFETLDSGWRRPARAHRASSAVGRAHPTSSSGSAVSTAATRRRSRSAHEVGLDYVSCSPYRVPIARLAAAHAALGDAGPGTTA